MAAIYGFHHCCGTAELGAVVDSRGPEAILESIGARKYGVIVFTDRVANGYGVELADYIRERKLGEVYETPDVRNPNSGHDIRVWSWAIDNAAYAKWVRVRLEAKKSKTAPVKPAGAPAGVALANRISGVGGDSSVPVTPAVPAPQVEFDVGRQVRVVNNGATFSHDRGNRMLLGRGPHVWVPGAAPNIDVVYIVADYQLNPRGGIAKYLITEGGRDYIIGPRGLAAA